MVETRARTREKEPPPRPAITAKAKTKPQRENKNATRKRKASGVSPTAENDHALQPREKKSHASASKTPPAKPAADVNIDVLNALISKYGLVPLSDLNGLGPSGDDASETVMVHIFNAMLSSGRISHEIAERSLKCVLQAGYHDLKRLNESTWEQRTEVLTEGGYTHYREKTATAFGDLAKLLEDKYDNDASRLLPANNDKNPSSTLISRLKEIKQLGSVGVEIFVAGIQGFYPRVAPFLDSRSFKTAQELGLGGDINAMFEVLDKDPMRMAMLNVALTTVRLEKRENEFS